VISKYQDSKGDPHTPLLCSWQLLTSFPSP
jgi:hypothetical protein